MKPHLALTLCTLLAVLAAADPAAAGSKAVPPAAWDEAMDETERLLLEDRWEEALETIDPVAREMMNEIVTGRGAARLLAKVSRLRALAEAGMGRQREAAWEWATALELDPELGEESLERFGEAGRLLQAPREEPEAEGADEPREECIKVQPPKKVNAPKPSFPHAQRRRSGKQSAEIIVQLVIDKQGELGLPRVLKAEDVEPVYIFSTLDAMRDWRFQPARCNDENGRPLAVYYNMTIRFST